MIIATSIELFCIIKVPNLKQFYICRKRVLFQKNMLLFLISSSIYPPPQPMLRDRSLPVPRGNTPTVRNYMICSYLLFFSYLFKGRIFLQRIYMYLEVQTYVYKFYLGKVYIYIHKNANKIKLQHSIYLLCYTSMATVETRDIESSCRLLLKHLAVGRQKLY